MFFFLMFTRNKLSVCYLINGSLLCFPDLHFESLEMVCVLVQSLLSCLYQFLGLQGVLGRLAIVLQRILVNQLDVVEELVPGKENNAI